MKILANDSNRKGGKDLGISSILQTLQQALTLALVLLACAGCSGFAPSLDYNPWETVPLATDATLFDLGFISDDPRHGWLIGNHTTLLETTDAGKTWQVRNLDLDGQDYRFTSISFSGQDGWIAGSPAILLHTTDGGQSWSRISLSAKLPGAPYTVRALGPESVELTTDVGAIYRTQDGGKTWRAMVQEAVGVLRNIARSPDGKYVSVSARGNFYSTWEPGQAAWVPHNRTQSRRIQNMGFTQDGRLWMLSQGGSVQFSDLAEPDKWSDPQNPQQAVSMGLLDLAYRTPQEIWLSGGGGNLLCSFDGGQTWRKDEAVEHVPSNLYKIIFVGPEQGFVIGQKGTLLRYTGQAQAALAVQDSDSA